MTDLRKWSENAFVMLAGLKESVQWELAPAIMNEIKELVDAYPVGAVPSEGMKPLSPARSGEPSAPQTRAEQYIGSDQERVFLEKKALGDLAAPQPVSGDAPKVEEVPLARKAAYALAYADAVAVDEMEAILRPYFPPASQTPKFGIYIASKTKHAQKWKDLRAAGEPIISTWIDESGIGETKSFEDLWERCIDEAASAERLVVYAEEGDELKGALVEVGAALASGTPVWIVGTVEALKTARNHRLMRKAASIKEAFSGVHTVATPASTARTDALLNLLRAADDVLAEQSLINQRFTQKQDALFAELMGWRDANGILAAPGSVPQAPVAANTPCSEHKVFHPACADCWKEYYKSPAFCVPQAEPKEEKP